GSLPPAGPGDGRTPIFDTIESNWFRPQDGGSLGGNQRLTTEPPGSGRPASAVPPTPPRDPQPTSRGTGEAAGVGAGPGANGSGTNSSGTNGSGLGTNAFGASGTSGFGPGANGTGPASNWRTSPNDDSWRRAEQLREEGPAAGGVTSSGLPRRVPRANLVEGAAQQQQSRPTGPQVSRAPDDVRGRLTNLRRGIQQGRRAGTGPSGNHDRGVGPTYQQER
ncbi:MAG: histidine kinase, partial [Streptomyces sp.]|nr:histidine kinase [Streptomyces sp.]